jgi:hypothetical protein
LFFKGGVEMELTGEFLGFSYAGYRSETLGMFRTAKGFTNDNWLPTLQDITATITKGTGSLYYGSTYTQRSLSMSFAFEGVDDEQISLWKKIFNDTKINKLILDESPYKSYRVKPNGVSTIKHLAFTKNGQRYYNGEGTITFIAFFPYAISEYSMLTTE